MGLAMHEAGAGNILFDGKVSGFAISLNRLVDASISATTYESNDFILLMHSDLACVARYSHLSRVCRL
jgi:hypothetical protein